MTPTLLTGFIIHSRPYQEKRAIYQFFSKEWGVVHGVGKHGLPSFVVLELFVGGKNSLKNFSQIHPKSTLSSPSFGQSQYALLYLNELICKLIALENPCPSLWCAYQKSVSDLQKANDLTAIKRILRDFETSLFDELGVSIDWQTDNLGQAIEPTTHYQFTLNQGFVKTPIGMMGEAILSPDLMLLGQIHRQLIDFLLDYKPLNSRKLWAEQLKYR
ncbi:MAG: DNA repair protein RecO C-terminal domain-containing protein [Moraxella sp.]|uniref:DNA repair protein RecO n=1 Tax=Moraxella sp. TaxID=479 RepID=UPI0026DC1291|nr:DNA repair protein RecO C-terminal domain-containing protein [Moraxella sp.]MDO4450559.1 DNA repair protein RecO C-terminal domain-containing protein [Moraxella sp.]